MPGPHCLIYEPDVTGHRLQHVHHLADALLAIGCRVTLALQADCREHAEYRVHAKALEPHVDVYARLDPHHSLRFMARRRRVAELIDTMAALEPDWCYVPYADATTQLGTLESILWGNGPFRRVPIEAQIMRGKYGYPRQSRLDAISSAANRYLTRRNPWHVMHILDPFALNGLKPLPREHRFRLIPEPVEPLPAIDQLTARATLGIPGDGRYLAFVGGLYPHKGIEHLVAGFARAELVESDRLLFVGKMAPPIRELFNSAYDALLRQGRIIVIDRYVSDHELGSAFVAADVIAVAHPRQVGSSGTLVRGAAAKRLLLSSDFGWIGWATAAFRLGVTVNVTDLDRYAAAINTALEQSGDYRLGTAAERFCAYHTVANQQAHWIDEICRVHSLARGPIPECIPWSWVMEAVDAVK